MSRIVYVNGSYVPEEEAKVSVFDRAFLFGDGIYEVTAVVEGKLLDFAAHLSRLDRSLRRDCAWLLPSPMTELRSLHEELIARNKLDEGIVYLEITRGVAERDFAYPEDAKPTVVAFTQSRPLIDNPYAATGRQDHHHPRHSLEAARHQIDGHARTGHGQASSQAERRL